MTFGFEYRVSFKYVSPWTGDTSEGSRISSDLDSVLDQYKGLKELSELPESDSDRVWDISIECRVPGNWYPFDAELEKVRRTHRTKAEE